MNGAARTAKSDMSIWYLGDATIAGRVDEISEAIECVKRELTVLNLCLNDSKCEAAMLGTDVDSWKNRCLTRLRTILPHIRETPPDILQLLGAPIDDAETRRHILRGS